MRAREITISGAPVFTFELSLLRVSARHPRAVRGTELVRGFAAASLSWRRCTAATPNVTAYCGRQKSTSGDILESPRRGACHWNVLQVEELLGGSLAENPLCYNPYTFQNAHPTSCCLPNQLSQHGTTPPPPLSHYGPFKKKGSP